MSLKRVLVIDDDPIALGYIFDLLKDLYSVSLYPGGTGVPKVIEKTSPDLIITDHFMDGMTGLEICQWVRDREISSDIPIIMTSANPAGSTVEQECLEAGASQFMTKGFDPNALIETVDTLLNKKESG